MALQELELQITGMTCSHCVASVTNAIKALEGIQKINVDLTSNKASLVFDNALNSVENIIQAVSDTYAYEATVINQ